MYVVSATIPTSLTPVTHFAAQDADSIVCYGIVRLGLLQKRNGCFDITLVIALGSFI